MKNRTDVFCALALLGACAVGGVGVVGIPGPMGGEAVGPASFPVAILILLTACAGLLLARGLLPVTGQRRNLWPERPVLVRVFLFLMLFFFYLFMVVAGGDLLASMERPPVESGGAFSVATVLFLLAALPLLGRKKPLEMILVALGITASLLLVFGHFFQVILP